MRNPGRTEPLQHELLREAIARRAGQLQGRLQIPLCLLGPIGLQHHQAQVAKDVAFAGLVTQGSCQSQGFFQVSSGPLGRSFFQGRHSKIGQG